MSLRVPKKVQGRNDFFMRSRSPFSLAICLLILLTSIHVLSSPYATVAKSRDWVFSTVRWQRLPITIGPYPSNIPKYSVCLSVLLAWNLATSSILLLAIILVLMVSRGYKMRYMIEVRVKVVTNSCLNFVFFRMYGIYKFGIFFNMNDCYIIYR